MLICFEKVGDYLLNVRCDHIVLVPRPDGFQFEITRSILHEAKVAITHLFHFFTIMKKFVLGNLYCNTCWVKIWRVFTTGPRIKGTTFLSIAKKSRTWDCCRTLGVSILTSSWALYSVADLTMPVLSGIGLIGISGELHYDWNRKLTLEYNSWQTHLWTCNKTRK